LENLDSPINNLFLIGAGFTRAVFPEAPLNADLLRSIIDNNPKTLLEKYKLRYQTDDIEILLTRMDLEAVELQSERLKQDRQKINEEIAAYFRQFRFGKHEARLRDTSWLQQLAKSVFTEYDAIVSLNYDCLLDGALDYYKVWSPSKGYGAADVKVEVPGTDFEKLPNPKNILIYKIHGSENFQTTTLKSPNIDTRKIGVVVNGEIYPESARNSQLGVADPKQSYIIAPSFVKTFYPQIERMMIGALRVAAKAKNFVIIGCSLRLEDSFLWLVIAAFLSEGPDKPIIVVDPKAETLRDRIKDYWRDAKVHTITKGIEEGIDDLLSLVKGNEP